MLPRRVVTAVAEDGRSVVVEPKPIVEVEPLPGMRLLEQWACDQVGPEILTVDGGLDRPFSPGPSPGGLLYRLVEFPPDPHGQMHRTPTVDLVAVVAGELVLVLDGGEEITLRAGDTVVQHGANHAWRNLTDRPALAAVVMVSAEG